MERRTAPLGVAAKRRIVVKQAMVSLPCSRFSGEYLRMYRAQLQLQLGHRRQGQQQTDKARVNLVRVRLPAL